jgi:hypothetical protein
MFFKATARIEQDAAERYGGDCSGQWQKFLATVADEGAR